MKNQKEQQTEQPHKPTRTGFFDCKNLIFRLIQKIQTEQRNQKTMRPAWIRKPLANNAIDLFTKDPPNEYRNDGDLNKRMYAKIQPALFRSRFVCWLNCFG